MRLVAHNFTLVNTAPVADVGITQLISLLDCEQEDAAHKYAVVSKYVSKDYSTTAYDARSGRLLRARHVFGVSGILKDIARRRPHVQLLGKHDLYQPADTTAPTL